MTVEPRVDAIGGGRTLPAPDPIARDYLVLALRLDQLRPGIVDAYVGPADLKADVDVAPLRPAARLGDDAAAIIRRLPAEVDDPDRRDWLATHLAALGAHAAVLAGESPGGDEIVGSLTGLPPEIVAASATAAFEERRSAHVTVPAGRGILSAAARVVDRLRAAAETTVGIPSGEAVRLVAVEHGSSLVRSWYDGRGRSRLDVRIDAPTDLGALLRAFAREAYPGRHLDRSWKDALLIESGERAELAVDVVDTPGWFLSAAVGEAGAEVLSRAIDIGSLAAELVSSGLAITSKKVGPISPIDRSMAEVAMVDLVRAWLDVAPDPVSNASSDDATVRRLRRLLRTTVTPARILDEVGRVPLSAHAEAQAARPPAIG